MPYDPTIQTEAQYVDNLGSSATEDKFHATYNGILAHWFPTSRGYIIDHQEPEYIIVRHAGGYRNPLLIVELKRPSKWTAAGQNEVLDDLQTYIEGQFKPTQYNTIYGVGGIGLYWMVCKMEKSGGPQPTLVLDWQNNIASDASYTQFQTIANLVYNII
ncbi:hypothetical protein AZE42_09235 [Rhizopogon vesiculosus]|uniref:Fungal-type protein kinase domain-containing protein n=1 Tax=Rhizopogon vesiculosus TaxID=180088 RepID=A0A1J8QD83_9AGAM|nr:hypothetical protein AZE42_09235 [Rhizopogon vesiculosus]